MKAYLRNRVAMLLVAALLATGCAHDVSRRTRVARVLVGVGAATTVAGGLIAAGCADVGQGEGGCSGGPGDADLAAGIPVMAIGAGLIISGLLTREKGSGRLLPPPNSLRGPVPPNQLPY